MNRSTPGLPVHHQLQEFTQTHVHRVSDAIQPSHPLLPLLLLPPIPPSIRVFSNQSTLHMRWPKYWSFSFSISPSKEIPGLISFGMDWLDLLAGSPLCKYKRGHIGTHTAVMYVHLPLTTDSQALSTHITLSEVNSSCFWVRGYSKPQ